MVLGFGLVFICRRSRRNQSEKALVTNSNPQTDNNRQSHLRDNDYEEIQDPTIRLHLVAAGANGSVVYANTQLPTMLCDDPTYSTIQSVSQSEDPLYSTAQLPKMQSAKPGEENDYKGAGYVGHSVTFKYKYEDADKGKSKYVCKNENDGCHLQTRTHKKDNWMTKDRFSLYDNTTGRFVLVYISDLTKEDAGIYWCVIDEPFDNDSQVSLDKSKAIQLDILTGEANIMNMTGYVGGAVLMKCNFSRGHSNYTKYFCRKNLQGPECIHRIRNHVSDGWETQGRFSLFYNSSANFSYVNISKLTKEDSGKYNCAVDIPVSHNRQVTVDESIEQKLDVEEDSCCKEQTSIRATVGQELNITCNYTDQHRENPKFFCKENGDHGCPFNFTSQDSRQEEFSALYALHDDKDSRTLVVSFRKVSESESGHYLCGVEVNWESGGYRSFITKVSVEEPTFNPITSFQGNNTESADSDCVYEEIQDTCISASEINTVYVKAQLPTIPCTDPTYVNVKLPTIPGSDPTHSAAQSALGQPEGSRWASAAFRKTSFSNIELVTLKEDEPPLN
ncbi:hypothetical protein ACEWY4_017384 [Coilia grayii]|uniref:Ig-like domain-containing protein n=1 Tax=Coilia grayii TaxID=363190 RepID=A0ABD1JIX7_9TELE